MEKFFKEATAFLSERFSKFFAKTRKQSTQTQKNTKTRRNEEYKITIPPPIYSSQNKSYKKW